VARPAAYVSTPGTIPSVVHTPRWNRGWLAPRTRNIVEPYMSIRSPGAATLTEYASAQASIVPVTTGVPGASPVWLAAAALTWPAITPGQTSSGSSTRPASCRAQVACQSAVVMSYIGSYWLAVW
jgi:hypothetical protein